jgi:hypothetical protein
MVTFSINSSYFGSAIHKPSLIADMKTLDFQSVHVQKHVNHMNRLYGQKTQFIYHRVMNMLSYGENKKIQQKSPSNDSTIVQEKSKPTWSLKSAISSQYDIAYYLKDALLYNDQPLNMTEFQRIVRNQIYSGGRGYETLRRLPNSTITITAFYRTSTKQFQEYMEFSPDDCHT